MSKSFRQNPQFCFLDKNIENPKLFDYNSIKDDKFITVWSVTHFLQGVAYALVCAKVFNLSFVYSFIVILVFHTLYEYKDYHLTYVVDPMLIERARRRASQIYWGSFVDLVLPPNTFINSVGDTFFCIVGVIVGYSLAGHVSYNTTRVIAKLAVVHFLIMVTLTSHILSKMSS